MTKPGPPADPPNAAAESIETLQTLLDHAPSMMWVKRADGTYVTANRALLESASLTLDQVRGHTDADLWAPEIATRYRDDDAHVLAKGVPTARTDMLNTSRGTRWMEV